jgi:hypothetical protein
MATMSILGGIIPEFSWHSSKVVFSSFARTQEFSNEQITKYAKAVLEIETRRQQAYQKIQQIIGQTPPEITCNRRDTFRNLPREAQKIAVEYCNSSKKIVATSGLSVAEFNAITTRVQSDRELKTRIQNEIIRIRQQKAQVKAKKEKGKKLMAMKNDANFYRTPASSFRLLDRYATNHSYIYFTADG